MTAAAAASSSDALLEERRVVVAGGAGALGYAIVERLLTAGARVLVADISEYRLQQVAEQLGEVSAGATLATVTADLGTPEGVDAVFERADSWLGGVDALVACTGVGSAPLMETTHLEWRRVIAANLIGHVACTQAAIERMRTTSTDPTIVLVGSISVHIMAVGESAYNAAKGGVATFAETLRKELMGEGIRVTLIEPGAMDTPMQTLTAQERAGMVRDQRLLDPGDVAEAIMFALTRPAGVDIVTLRIEPQVQKIW